MTSVEAILVNLMPRLNTFMPVAITFDVVIQNNFSKPWKFSREISFVELRYGEAIVVGVHINFIYDSETYDIVNIYCGCFKLYLSFDSSFLSIKIVHYSN